MSVVVVALKEVRERTVLLRTQLAFGITETVSLDDLNTKDMTRSTRFSCALRR